MLTKQTQMVQFSVGGENTAPSALMTPLWKQPWGDKQERRRHQTSSKQKQLVVSFLFQA